MSVTFPTSPRGHTPPGTPHRASHCRCRPHGIRDPESGRCVLCGRDAKDEIAEAWRDRAQRMATTQAKRARRAA